MSPKILGFVVPNQGSTSSLNDHFVLSVDEIEVKPGINFFSQPDNSVEARIESKIELVSWGF